MYSLKIVISVNFGKIQSDLFLLKLSTVLSVRLTECNSVLAVALQIKPNKLKLIQRRAKRQN